MMMPRYTVILAYTLVMIALVWGAVHISEKPSKSKWDDRITWSRFSEAPTCRKGIDGLSLNTSTLTLTKTRPARIEIDTVAACEKPFAGYVTAFDGLYVLTLTTEPYLVGSLEYEMSLCLCPHRFVYEFGPEYIEGNKTIFVKNGFVSGEL